MKPKKSLGQNFLRDEKALQEIVEAAELKMDDLVLEIGPGEGALTRAIAETVKEGKLIAIEKDEKLAENMARNFKFQISNLPRRQAGFQSIYNDLISNFKDKNILIVGDILKINLPELIRLNNFKNYKVVANIPYYITGKIVRLLLETNPRPGLIVLLVQKEVAERICASPREMATVDRCAKHISHCKPGKMSILTVAAQYYARCEICGVVPKESFFPKPKVDSAILKMRPLKDEELIAFGEEKEFFRLVKIGFSAPRKMLLNNLSGGLKIERKEILKLLAELEISSGARPGDLELKEWKALFKRLN